MSDYRLSWRQITPPNGGGEKRFQAKVGVVHTLAKMETHHHGIAKDLCPVVASCQAFLKAVAKFDGPPGIIITKVTKGEDSQVKAVWHNRRRYDLCSFSGQIGNADAAFEAVQKLAELINQPHKEAVPEVVTV